MKVLFFDCETSGLKPGWNKMLQLSWQLVDTCRWKVISKQNFYFRHPGKDKVEEGAIHVNGLTKEALERLGTVPRSKGIKAFAKDMAMADICVAHNFAFDSRFINEEDTKDTIKWPKEYCTMKGTANLCKIPFKYRPDYVSPDQEYKWPRLSELADYLGINIQKLHLHDSSADVELTKRCFRALVKNGFFTKNLTPNPVIAY